MSLALIVIALLGLIGLRTSPKRLRIGFDVLLLAALTGQLLREGALPFGQGAPVAADHLRPLLTCLLVAWWLVCARLVVAILYFAFGREGKSRQARLFLDLLAAALYICIGLLLIHWVLDLPVRGLVATSGVVAVVIGLALQSTLADVFAGIAVGIENPFQVGDRIALTGNLEGLVVEINWRSIRIQTDGADLAIVPNSLVAKQQIINRSIPDQARTSSIEVWCPDVADSERVIDVLQQAILLCPTILQVPPPAVSMTRLALSANCYAITFAVSSTEVLSGTRSQLLRHARRQLYNAGLLHRRRPSKSDAPARLSDGLFFREVTLFESLNTQQIEALAACATRRVLEPGDILFRADTIDRTLYVVASGILDLTHDNVRVGRLGAGGYVGEIGLLTGSAHPATAVALSRCEVLQLPEAALRPLLATNIDVATAFEKAARQGLELLRSDDAGNHSEHTVDHERLRDRLRAFFARMEGPGSR